MGNRASYNQVPIGDMNSPSIRASALAQKATDSSRPADNNPGGTDLMFVFHETEEDSLERVVHEQIENQRDIEKELKFSISLNDKVICERKTYAEPTDVHSLCSIMHPGDLVEFCAIGQAHHWVVYMGSGSCVRLKEGCVTEERIFKILPDRMARIVSEVYKFKALPAAQICDAARSQVGKDSVWSTSECFAAWCRFSCPELISDQMEIRDLDSMKTDTTTEKCKIDLYNDFGEIIETKHFTNLVELIKYRRKREQDES